MTFAELVAVADQVAATRSRSAKIALLADLLRRLDPAEVPVAVGLLSGQPRQGKLGLGWSALTRAREGTPSPLRENESARPMTLAELDATLAEVKSARGAGSQQRRQALLEGLGAAMAEPEWDFLARLIIGELRQGALEGVVIEAIAAAAAVPAATVRLALTADADLGAVAARALSGGAAALAVEVAPFRPLSPMLAQPAEDAAAALDGLGEVSVEHKLDGARIQLHKRGAEVRIYSRGLREVSPAIPELVAAGRALAPHSVILDGEAIALRDDGRPEPFQVTMQRFGRRTALEAGRPLHAFYFDCLLVDGVALLDRPLRERLAALDAAVPADQRVSRAIARGRGEVSERFAAALADGQEGVMIKDLAAPYLAGQRGGAWRKLKQARTVDLVVLAAEWGSGRRRGFLSNLHLGARDPAGGFVMLGKTFKGMSDEILAWQTRELLAREIDRDGHIVFVRPELVVEIAFNDVQRSSQYPGGVALRFARLKGYRPDRTPAEADTIAAVQALAP
jgi:DNA ligase 1